MLALLAAMDLAAYCPRVYVVAATDKCATAHSLGACTARPVL
jgi:hypothetical protein